MNILITGCAGFIGSHAVDEFLNFGYNIIGIDNLTYAGNLLNLDSALKNSKFEFIKEDIANFESINLICKNKKIDWIINFAAETHVDNSINSMTEFIHSNIIGVSSLLQCCKQNNIKLLQISTDEVYGSIDSNSFSETDRLNPLNPYAATKAAADHLILSYNNTFKIDYIIVRPSNNFGERQNIEKLLPKSITSLINNKKIQIYGNGSNIREWTYVKDTVKAIRFLLEKNKLNEIYNISSQFELTNINIANTLCQLFNLNTTNSIEFIEDRKGHDSRYSINIEKLLLLDYKIESSFFENIKNTIEWFKNNNNLKRNIIK